MAASTPKFTLPMSDDLREAVIRMRPMIGARSEAGAIRAAIGEMARKLGLDVPGDPPSAAMPYPDPDDRPTGRPPKAVPAAEKVPQKKGRAR